MNFCLAVIPTVFVYGPLALLATLFPAIFGGVALLWRRWQMVFWVISIDGALYLVHSWLCDSLRPEWWESPSALWTMMCLTVAGGAWLAWQESRSQVAHAGGGFPSPADTMLVLVLALADIVAIGYCGSRRVPLDSTYGHFLLMIGGGALAGIVQQTWSLVAQTWKLSGCGGHGWSPHFSQLKPGLQRPQPAIIHPRWATDLVILGGMAASGLGISVHGWLTGAFTSPAVRVAWTFAPRGSGWFASSPLADGPFIYTAVAHHDAAGPGGTVYCLARQTGNVLWTFDDGGAMKPILSSPFLSAGRLYIGEGFHGDALCKVYCLDGRTGAKLWAFETKGHTESSPRVEGVRVYVGAGDDGLYCLHAQTGSVLWHHEGPHVDGRPAVDNGRVFAGSGYGDFSVFCLAAETGTPLWRIPVEFPSFGAPAVAGDTVFFGLGNGNLMSSDPAPAGTLLCVEAATGKERWSYAVGDAVHSQPVVTDRHVFFTARDQHCYCLDRNSGKLQWRQDLDSPMVTTPVLAADAEGAQEKLYLVTSEGLLCCLDPRTGAGRWTFDVTEHARARVAVISSPAVVFDRVQGKLRAQVFFGAQVQDTINRPALYCVEER